MGIISVFNRTGRLGGQRYTKPVDHPQPTPEHVILDDAAQLRWHPALRRRLPQARLAASVWSATLLADRAGLPPTGDLARRVVEAEAGEDERWQTFRPIRASMDYLPQPSAPAVTVPGPQVMMALLREAGIDLAAVNTAYLRQAAGDLAAASVPLPGGQPAGLVRAARVSAALSLALHARVDERAIFAPRARGVVVGALKIVSVRSGLDPTGVAVIDDPLAAGWEALVGIGRGQAGAEDAWYEQVVAMVHAAIQAGRQVCEQVAAGARNGGATTRSHPQ